jgi:hypothetical protein
MKFSLTLVLFLTIIVTGCGGSESTMSETQPLLIDISIEDVNAEGVVDPSQLRNSNLQEVHNFFKAPTNTPPRVSGELYFSGSNASVFRELDFGLPLGTELVEGRVFELNTTGLPYGFSLYQIPVDNTDPNTIQWGATTGSITVTRLQGNTATYTVDALTTGTAPAGLKPIRIRGTITIDFDRQENVIPPF